MTRFKPALSSLFMPLALLAFSPVTSAAPNDADWRELNLQTIEHHVLPRYKNLADAATQLATSTEQLCKNTTEAQLQNARRDFNLTMDAWQGIQHIRTGPIELLMRNYSLQFWPDKKNHVGRNLDELLASENTKLLTTDDFYSISVSVPGLPALERLLYNEDTYSLKQLQASKFRCSVTARIAKHVETMATGMSNEWQSQRLPEYQNTGAEESLFQSNEEGAVELLRPLPEQLAFMRESKLLRPLGDNLQQARERRLESWRSARSLANLKLNLKALHGLYAGEGEQTVSLRSLSSESSVETIDAQFETLKQQLEHVAAPIEQHLKDADTHARLSQAAEQIELLSRQLRALMNELDIFLGFNSKDGD